MKPLNIAGERFGRLVAVASTQMRSGGKIVWECKCDCGGVTFAAINHLRDGRRVSCGCAKIAGSQIKIKKPKHGHCTNGSSSRTYRIWSGMKSRCTNNESPNFKHYGGRGISICERWESFENFLADMGEAPAGCSIDRIDVDGHYAPENCRWANDIEQHRNRRDNVFISHQGMKSTISQWAEETGINKHTIADRIKKGLPSEKALDKRIASKSEASIIGNRIRWGRYGA